jgi:hypothetical protein
MATWGLGDKVTIFARRQYREFSMDGIVSAVKVTLDADSVTRAIPHVVEV